MILANDKLQFADLWPNSGVLHQFNLLEMAKSFRLCVGLDRSCGKFSRLKHKARQSSTVACKLLVRQPMSISCTMTVLVLKIGSTYGSTSSLALF